MSVHAIEVGDKIKCWNDEEQNYVDAEILRIKDTSKKDKLYYIHFCDLNKRLEDWYSIDHLDLSTLVKKPVIKNKNADLQKMEDDLAFLGVARNIEYLHFGDYKMKAWYFSPLPEPYFDLEVLYCCEFCLHFFANQEEYNDHCKICDCTHPPGDEIYRKGRLSAYEVDGEVATRWCTNLCLITKLFLYHKSAYYSPEPFLFYVLCFNDTHGAHLCGFFSKEKDANCPNNLSCILALPCYQKVGVGRFLIQLSYELSKIEHKPGGPEIPLSDLGYLAYYSYWKSAVLKAILDHQGERLSISMISSLTGMTESDVQTGARKGGYIRKTDDQGWVFGVTTKQIEEWKEKEKRRLISLDPKAIRWTPYPRNPKPIK